MLLCMPRFWFLVVSFALLSVCPSAHSQTKAFATQSAEQLKAGIEDKHPSVFYVLAAKLFESGKKDEATLWFYIGEIRYRILLRSREKGADEARESEMFSALSDKVGIPVNRYAFGDIPVLIKIMGDALNWDDSHRNGYTSKQQFKDQYELVRNGLKQMREEIVQKTGTIKEQRIQNGLDNRQ
jgi:hypothetical protein